MIKKELIKLLEEFQDDQEIIAWNMKQKGVHETIGILPGIDNKIVIIMDFGVKNDKQG